MNWKHGYHADAGYTYGYYPETMPSRLYWASLIQGQITPIRNFRYLDAGCGQGLNLILAAAAHPDSEFVGLDFMPDHIAHAQALAKRCGLKNVQFIEADFVQLTEDKEALKSIGAFDYAVCHGITTWVSPRVKKALFQLIGHTLKPGGVFYNSYNTLPGWLNMIPFQHLVLLEQERRTGSEAILAARSTIEELVEHAHFLDAFPTMKGRLDSFKTQDPSYLVQEYNNLSWKPVFVTEMVDALAEVKLDYLGSATLGEVFLDDLPTPLRKLIDSQPNQKLKLQVQDYGINQSFRRDLYVKGMHSSWSQDINEKILNTRFVTNKVASRPKLGESYTFVTGALKAEGNEKNYSALLDQLDSSEGALLKDLKINDQALSTRSLSKMISLLMQGGWVLPLVDKKVNSTRINREIIDAFYAGAPYKYIALAAMGSALPLNEIEMMIAGACTSNLPEGAWAGFVVEKLERLGRTLNKDGMPLTDRKISEQMIQEQISALMPRIDWLKAVGAL
jgi:SAM-dependent methyltransferase